MTTEIQGIDACPNCGEPRRGPWCHACGQRNVHERLSSRTILGDVVDHVFNVDSRVLTTLRGMTLRPGATGRAYVEGRRARIVNPIRYCVVFVALYFLIRNAVGVGLLDDVPIGLATADAGSQQAALQEYMAARIGGIVDWVAIACAPLLALVMPLFFRSPATNFAERLSFAFLLQGQSFLYALLLLPLVFVDPGLSGTVRTSVHFLFFAWAIPSFYGQNRPSGWIRGLLAWTVTTIIVAFLAVLLALPFAVYAARELGMIGSSP